MYLTATSLEGPWTFRGNFAPEGSLTWNSQSTFVLPVINKKDTVLMFMGDRWSFPKTRFGSYLCVATCKDRYRKGVFTQLS